MLSVIKKIVNKLYIFGLSVNISFGLGSFLANAALPDFSIPGNLINVSTNIDEYYDIQDSKKRIVIGGIIGARNIYNGKKQPLLDPVANLNLNNITVKIIENGNTIINYNWIDENSNTGSAANLASLGINPYNFYVYIRAVNTILTSNGQTSIPDSSTLATPWVPLIARGARYAAGTISYYLQAAAAGTYKFYYYVDSEQFDTAGIQNNSITPPS